MAVVSNEERNLNYDNFIGRLDIELQRAKRYGRLVSVCIISIDGAHENRDTFPKSFLRDFTQMVLDQARTVDISTTISSEEFAMILPVFLLILMFAIDFGRLFYLYIGLNGAAREGAAFGANQPAYTSGIGDQVRAVQTVGRCKCRSSPSL